MKNLTVLVLAVIAVVTLVYAGIDGMTRDHSTGVLFVFIGTCTAVGLTIDIYNHVKERLRRSRISKLGGS